MLIIILVYKINIANNYYYLTKLPLTQNKHYKLDKPKITQNLKLVTNCWLKVNTVSIVKVIELYFI